MPTRLASLLPGRLPAALFVLALLVLGTARAANTQYVRFNTVLGSIDVLMLSDQAPNTVTNFLGYVNSKAYNASIIHRSISAELFEGFTVIQGGSYEDKLVKTAGETDFAKIPTNAPIANEFSVSNTLGTLAMAYTGTNTNSGTSGWFFNTSDNSSAFDSELYTVFGQINSGDASSLAVMNALQNITIYDATSVFMTGGEGDGNFADIPLIDYYSGSPSYPNFVEVTSIVTESQPSTATVTLSSGSITVPYTGKATTVTATTNPAKLKTIISYSSALTPPTATGTYTVLADITSPGYAGSATGTIVITPVLPIVTTGAANVAATDAGATAADLYLSVNPRTSDTTVYVEYGLSSSAYTGSTTTVDAGAGATTESGYLTTTGTLTAGTLYHYRAVATNAAGTVYGADKTFTTELEPVFGGTGTITPLLSATGAQVGFAVNPQKIATKAYFEYSTSQNFSTYQTTAEQTIGAGNAPFTVTGFLADLEPNTTYYYELVTVSSAGTFTSAVQSFTTLGFNTSIVAVSTGKANGTGTTTGTATYATLGAAGINDTDGVAFYSTLTASKSNPVITAANDAGIWANRGSDTLTLVAQTGTTTPAGVASAVYSVLGNPVYNENSEVAFEGTMKAGLGGVTSKNALGVWATNSGSLTLVARQGDTAPNGMVFSTFTALARTGTNTIIFGTVTGTGVTAANNFGVFEGTAEGNLALVLHTGETIGSKVVSTYTLNSIQTLVQGQTRNFNDESGDLALLATFTDKTTGIVTDFTGTVTVADKVGDTAPGVSGTFSKFDSPIVNESDHVAFWATLASSGTITAANNAGIWADNSSGSLTLVAETGVPTSATPAGSGFLTLSDPIDNNNDVLAFEATYKSGSTALTGLFFTPGGTVTRVAQTGGAAPGCGGGVTFATFKALGLPDAGGADGTGGPVFMATVAGTGVSAANNTGIWAMDASGNLQLVVRTGDNINVSPSGTAVFKTISTLTFLPYTASLDGQTRSITKDGDLTFTATFTDKTTAVFSVAFP
jgi:cyclophilin family peptidyl-prolyl cis-trans isomerase